MSESGPDRILTCDSKICSEPDGCVRIDVDELTANYKPVSVPTFFMNTVKAVPDKKALSVKRDGKWQSWTYREYDRDVRLTAKAFIELGLERFNSVSIFGFNSPEWFFSSLGAVFAGGFSCGLYPTNSSEINTFIMQDNKTNILVCEDSKAVDKMWAIRDQIPTLKHIIQYTGKPEKAGVLSWNEVIQTGKEVSDELLEERLNNMAINQCAMLIYTSGTTGNPKGVMLSHVRTVFKDVFILFKLII